MESRGGRDLIFASAPALGTAVCLDTPAIDVFINIQILEMHLGKSVMCFFLYPRYYHLKDKKYLQIFYNLSFVCQIIKLL